MAKSKGESEGKSVSQVEMVRLTLEELGNDAKPQAMQDHIKSKFNKDLPTTIISNYKSVLKRKAGTVSPGRGRKPASVSGGSGGGIHIEDLDAVRGLVSRLGAEQVKKLVEVFAR